MQTGQEERIKIKNKNEKNHNVSSLARDGWRERANAIVHYLEHLYALCEIEFDLFLRFDFTFKARNSANVESN